MKAGGIIRKVLDLLPGNGSKLKFGALLALLGQLPLLIPGVDIMELLRLILENPTKSGIITVIIGAVHKVLKAKFPKIGF